MALQVNSESQLHATFDSLNTKPCIQETSCNQAHQNVRYQGSDMFQPATSSQDVQGCQEVVKLRFKAPQIFTRSVQFWGLTPIQAQEERFGRRLRKAVLFQVEKFGWVMSFEFLVPTLNLSAINRQARLRRSPSFHFLCRLLFVDRSRTSLVHH